MRDETSDSPATPDDARAFLAALDFEGAVDAKNSFWTRPPDEHPTQKAEWDMLRGGAAHPDMWGAFDVVLPRISALHAKGACAEVALNQMDRNEGVLALRAVCCRWTAQSSPEVLRVDPSIVLRLGSARYVYWLLHPNTESFQAHCDSWVRLHAALERELESTAHVSGLDFKTPLPGFSYPRVVPVDIALYTSIVQEVRARAERGEGPSAFDATNEAMREYLARGGALVPPDDVQLEKCDASIRYELAHVIRGMGVNIDPIPFVLPPEMIVEDDIATSEDTEPEEDDPLDEVPAPQLDEARKYLQALDPTAERFTFQAHDDRGSNPDLARIFHGTLEQVAPALTSLNASGAAISAAVHATDFKGRKGQNIVSTRAFFCDWDDGVPPAGSGALPISMTVSRAADGRRKYHGYWLLSEPVALDQWDVVQRALVQKLDGDPAAILITQALRIPGFFNCKKQPVLVELEACHPERRYTVDQIIETYRLQPVIDALTRPQRVDKKSTSSGDGPADDYVARGDWSSLERAGWTEAYRYGDEIRWTKPGGKRKETHATTDHDGRHGIFKVFSSKAPPFVANKAYTRFQVLAELEHAGDYSATAKALVGLGYGQSTAQRRDAWIAESEEDRWTASMEGEEASETVAIQAPSEIPPDPPWFEGLESTRPGEQRAISSGGSGRRSGGGGRGGGGSGGSGRRPPPRGPSDGDMVPHENLAPKLWALNSVKAIAKGPDNIPMTHVGNRERFLDHYGNVVRYVKTFDRWYVWNGSRWRLDADAEETHVSRPTPSSEDLSAYVEASSPDPFDSGAYVQELAMQAARSMHALIDNIFVQARDDGGKKIVAPDGKPAQDEEKTERAKATWTAHCVRTESEGAIRQMLNLTRSHRDIARSPSYFDPYDHMINTHRGVHDLRTGLIYPHHPGFCQSKIVRIKSKRDGCPVWTRFLERVLNEDDDLIRFVQRAVGYSLTGETREQVLFLLYGTGRNGKSTFLNVLHALAGEYAQHAEFSTFVERQNDVVRNDLARLHKSRLVTAVEPKSTGYLDESVIKQVTGQDVVTARFLFKEHFEYVPRFKIWLAANHKPMIRGNDEGIWRRILMTPFTVTIPEDEKDPDLPRKLAAELPAILAWATDGAKIWYEEGLRPPKAVREATQAYRDEMDSLGNFLQIKCVMLPNVRSMSSALYQHYVKWTEIGGERPLSQKKFGLRLDERGFERHRTKRGYEYIGVAIADEGDHDDAQPRAYKD